MSSKSVSPPNVQLSSKDQDVKLPRKRNRIPVACSVCRKRKVKCDRGRPHCEVCQRYNVAHLCVYQEPSWTQNSFSGAKENPNSTIPPQHTSRLNDGPEFSDNANADNTLMEPKPQFTTFKCPVEPGNQSEGLRNGPLPAISINRFDNNIRSLINHSAEPIKNSSSNSLKLDDPPVHFKNYRNINPPQSNERSTSNFADSGISHPSNYLNSPAPISYRQLLPSIRPNSECDTISDDSVSPAIQSELERMKQKIKEIEASITLSKTFNRSTGNQNFSQLNKLQQTSLGDNHYKTPTAPTLREYENGSKSSLETNQGVEEEGFFKVPNGTAEPRIDPNDVLDFYADYISVHIRQSKLVSHGPLSWLTILKRDRFMKILWLKTIEIKKKHHLFPHNLLKRKHSETEQGKDSFFSKKGILISKISSEVSESNAEKKFHEKMLEQEGFNDIQPYKIPAPNFTCLSRNLTPCNLPGDKESGELKLIKLIEDTLPTKKIIWLGLDRFFKFIYPLFPCVDQGIFLKDISKIIGERSLEDEPVTDISIEKRLSLATVGTLLLFIRFGYLSVISNSVENKPEFDEETRFLLEHPVGPEVIVVAQSCLNQFELIRKTSIGIFQLALYMRLYHRYAPEEGDIAEGGDSLVFGGLLTHMGLSLGLNRDPLSFGINEKIVSLWRKLWNMLLLNDSKVTNSIGCPLSISEENYDTHPPSFLGEIYSNHDDLELERVSIDLLNQTLKWNLKLKEVTSLVSKMKDPPKLFTIINKLKEFDSFISYEFGTLNDLLTLNNNNHLDNVVKAKKIAAYLEFQTTVQVLYHFIFIHLEEKKNYQGAAYFLKKNLKIVAEIIFNFNTLIMDLHKYVGNGFDVYLTPKIEWAAHRTQQIQFALIVRSQHLKCASALYNGSAPELGLALDKFCETILNNVDIYLHGLSRLRGSHYFAWRILKQQRAVIGILKSQPETLFEVSRDMRINTPISNFFEGISVKEIEELTKIIDPHYLKETASIATERLFDDLINSLTAESVNYDALKSSDEVDQIWSQLASKTMDDFNELDFGHNNESNQVNLDSIFNDSFEFDIFDADCGLTLSLV